VSDAAILARLDGVACGYGEDPVLEHIDLTITSGQFLGVVGPSGSGKTTLLRVLTETVRPQRGTVHRADDLRIGYVPQVETVNWSFPVTVREAVLMARASTRRVPWAGAAENAEVRTTLGRLGIADLADRHIRDLSGGQQQRVFVARALLRQPNLLLLDEPTSGVDVRTRHDVLHLLADLNADGISIVLTTHDLNGIAAHLPYLVCLNRTVIGAGAPADVLTPEVLERTFAARMEVLEHGGMPVVIDHDRRGDRQRAKVGP
jgi:ABC-type Mn2+/Zn2+ transport system ATPase subunit